MTLLWRQWGPCVGCRPGGSRSANHPTSHTAVITTVHTAVITAVHTTHTAVITAVHTTHTTVSTAVTLHTFSVHCSAHYIPSVSTAVHTTHTAVSTEQVAGITAHSEQTTLQTSAALLPTTALDTFVCFTPALWSKLEQLNFELSSAT